VNNKKLSIYEGAVLGSVILISLFSFRQPAMGGEFVEESSQVVPLGEGGKVAVETLGGSVFFSGTADSNVKIEATRTVEAASEEKAKEIFEDFRIEVKQGMNKVKVTTVFPRKDGGFFSRLFGACCYRDVNVDYRITLPKNVDVHIDGTSTDVTGETIEGRVSLDITSGDVELRQIGGSVLVDGTSGDVNVVGVGGDLAVDNTSGDITASEIKGDVTIDKTGGTVDLTAIGGDISLDGTSCDVDATELNGNVETDMTSGDVKIIGLGGGIVHGGTSGDVEVEFAGPVKRSCNINTTSGDVQLTMSVDSQLNLILDTVSGDIRAKMPSMEIIEVSNRNLKAMIGSGGAKIQVETTSGDITLTGK
jgi:DUF4097 and DUF4098 domain-containing protein YvlB